jgi:pectate lyase
MTKFIMTFLKAISSFRIHLHALLACGLALFSSLKAAPLPSFPGAEGFGAVASGGRGGELYCVTTLADSGPGSLRDAVSRPNRTVVFSVGGIVNLASDISVSDNITIAGETAPGEGICLYGRSVSLSEHSNIIIRYLRIRQGVKGDQGKKSLGMSGSSRIIVDHCSLQWGRWDNLGITVKSHDITVQYCLIAEAIHPQSFGALIDSVTNITLSHNLWMSNESRNPKAKGSVQYVNNVVYNWGITGLCGSHSEADRALDVIGNYFIAGPSSNDRFAGQFLASDHVYQRDNFVDIDKDGILNGKRAEAADFHRNNEEKYSLPTFLSEPAMHPEIPVSIDDAKVALDKIVAGVGASLQRDAIDRRLIDELRSLGKKGSTLDHTDRRGEALVGGIQPIPGGKPPLDTDGDGIPDAWERAHQLSPQDPGDAAKLQPSGYSNLETYLHGRVAGTDGSKSP